MKFEAFRITKILHFLTHSGSFFCTMFIVFASVIIASWLMISTFSYDQTTHTMVLSSKVWSDFGAHIPLIRSFSMGDNLPRILRGLTPEYPLFPGAPIRYHFLFYMGVGIFERLGVRIDWALNSLSIIGFAGMLIAIYFVAKKLFNDWRVGLLAFIFTLLNGSLTFLKFFASRPLSFQTLRDLWDFNDFLSFAPWGSGDISAFWTLNIFTNQRHLAFAFAIFFFFLLTIITIENQKSKIKNLSLLPWGVICGLLPFFHQPTLITLAIACVWFILVIPKLRIPLFAMGFLTAVIAIPQLILLSNGQRGITIAIGYLIDKPLTVISFFSYWWHNIGAHLILIPIGFLISPKRAKLYLFPAFLFFAVGFCFQFSQELAANHKFFNLFLIMGSMFSSYAIIRIFNLIQMIKPWFLRVPMYIYPLCMIVFLTLSGIIDFMPIKNDRIMELSDIKANKNAEWFLKNTPPDAVILNASFFFHPASLAGRKIFLGWPYFSWSAGYDTTTRYLHDMASMYTPTSLSGLCRDLNRFNIQYITFEDGVQSEIVYDESLYKQYFSRALNVSDNNLFRIYERGTTCQ